MKNFLLAIFLSLPFILSANPDEIKEMIAKEKRFCYFLISKYPKNYGYFCYHFGCLETLDTLLWNLYPFEWQHDEDIEYLRGEFLSQEKNPVL